jgi:DNA repair protein RAD5
MGKTIMLSALIQTNRALTEWEQSRREEDAPKRNQLRLDNKFKPVVSSDNRTKGPSTATLIIAPTSLLTQWSEELERSSKPGTLKVVVWHGSNRLDIGRLQKGGGHQLVVVITSYGVLASEHAKVAKHGSSVFESKSRLSFAFAHC